VLETDRRRGARSRAWIVATAAGLLRRFTAAGETTTLRAELVAARRLLARVAEIHPADCDADDCPITPIRKYLRT